ncbi:hypothetical protein BURPS305_3554 [Burkholderia pseudomallei 305]|nr:hypothetical protein BURPS305_3554 [Burkholderia pseudomallei 305]EEC33983.1 conserved hypothetical protein [Burkholderia pseudomallei 576]
MTAAHASVRKRAAPGGRLMRTRRLAGIRDKHVALHAVSCRLVNLIKTLQRPSFH